MAKSQNDNKPKHLHGFWPLFFLLMITLVACGVIYAFAYGNILQDEVNSTGFWSRFAPHHQKAQIKTSAKTPATSTPLKIIPD